MPVRILNKLFAARATQPAPEAPATTVPDPIDMPATDVPAGWASLRKDDLLALAFKITGIAVTTKADAVALIKNHLNR